MPRKQIDLKPDPKFSEKDFFRALDMASKKTDKPERKPKSKPRSV